MKNFILIKNNRIQNYIQNLILRILHYKIKIDKLDNYKKIPNQLMNIIDKDH